MRSQQVARSGGEVAGIARKEIEGRTGQPVITSQNAADFQQLITDVVEDAAVLPEMTELADDGNNTES